MKNLAKGGRHPRMPQRLWVSVGLDDDTFLEIRAMAEAGGVSFNSKIRDLVEIGIETLKQDQG